MIADFLLGIINGLLLFFGSTVQIQTIHIAHPALALLGCAILLVIFVAFVRTRHTRIVRIGLVKADRPRAWLRTLMVLHTLCSWSALLFGVVMIAQCTIQVTSPAKPRPALFLLIDVSKSMTNPPPIELQSALQKSRKLDVVKHYAEQCIDMLAKHEGEIGLLCFSGEAFTVSPLTHDIRLLRFLLADIDFGMLPDGTALEKALHLARDRVRQAKATMAHLQPCIVVFTDGLVNTPYESTYPLYASSQSQSIPIKIVHIVSEQDKADTRFASAQSLLTSLTRITDNAQVGKNKEAYWQNPTETAIANMLQDIVDARLFTSIDAPTTIAETLDCSVLAMWGLFLSASMYAIGSVLGRML
jgi:uncharacterized protein YegL